MIAKKPFLKFILPAILMIALGFWLGRSSSTAPVASGHAGHEKSDVKKDLRGTCSMHPSVNLAYPGKCPICQMDLIPRESTTGNDEGPRSLKMSEASLKLAEIETRALKREEATVQVDMVGKVMVDPTRISDVALLADGEIRRLFVDYAGIPVKKGEHLAELYSPEIYSAGQDLLVALESNSADQELIESAVIKLKLLGVPQDYIDHIEKSRTVSETYILKSPRDGYVEKLMGYQGMWLKKGMMLCRVVNMSSLWILLDAYESDIAWVRYGQSVSIQAQAIPGRRLRGIISYIPPRLDDRSRTMKVRVNINNADGALKPGMFVSAEVNARVTSRGQVTSPKLKGKWISPMHPEIIKDKPGVCDVCGMQLVRAKDLGFSYDTDGELPLLLPSSAVLITGKRAVVYVRKPGKLPIFEGREITLGPKAGNNYVVLSGLKEGERIVVKGSFKIDSALQIQAKPSMMSMAGGGSLLNKTPKDKGLAHIDNTALRSSLEDFIDYYLEIHKKLAKDEMSGLSDLALSLKGELEYMDYSGLNQEELKLWKRLQQPLQRSLEHLEHRNNLSAFREQFKKISKAVLALVVKVGHPKKGLSLMYCAMADAQWLQSAGSTENPYYGASMLRCGEIKKKLPSAPTKD